MKIALLHYSGGRTIFIDTRDIQKTLKIKLLVKEGSSQHLTPT